MVTHENLESRLDEILSSSPIDFNHAVSERGKPIIPPSIEETSEQH